MNGSFIFDSSAFEQNDPVIKACADLKLIWSSP